MPYIPEAAREELLTAARTPATAGELNFCITVMVRDYLLEHGESYQHFNDCIGALEGAKLELYRRVVSNYEDEKIKANGDVY